MGEPVEAALGLNECMGLSDEEVAELVRHGEREIIDEFRRDGTSGLLAALDYVLNQPASELQQPSGAVRDQGHAGMVLDDFVKLDAAKEAKLSRAHVLSLRLYTSGHEGVHRCVNNPLRDRVRPHPFPAFTTFLTSALKKLRAVAARKPEGRKPLKLYRGMANLLVSKEFEDKGGTELACMSTTRDKNVAGSFAKSACPLVFEFCSKNFMDRGADVQPFSVYPGEAEVCYPPLTFLSCESFSERDLFGNGQLMHVANVTPSIP